MQIRYPSPLSGRDYVATEAWREARLDACPVHGPGCRTFARHGTYGRHTPWGPARIARHYCRAAQTTFSLLPDCLAAHLTGTLAALEDAAVRAERTDIATAAREAHPRAATPVGVSAGDAVRWLDRRVALVLIVLATLRGLLPETFGSGPATLLGMRAASGLAPLLPAMRELCADGLQDLPAPVGFRRRSGRTDPVRRRQQPRERDPPAGTA